MYWGQDWYAIHSRYQRVQSTLRGRRPVKCQTGPCRFPRYQLQTASSIGDVMLRLVGKQWLVTGGEPCIQPCIKNHQCIGSARQPHKQPSLGTGVEPSAHSCELGCRGKAVLVVGVPRSRHLWAVNIGTGGCPRSHSSRQHAATKHHIQDVYSRR